MADDRDDCRLEKRLERRGNMAVAFATLVMLLAYLFEVTVWSLAAVVLGGVVGYMVEIRNQRREGVP